MKSEKENKDIDINDVAIVLEVDSEVIRKLRTGDITHIIMEIDEDNQNLILEGSEGNLIVVVNEKLTSCHSCYLYNNGEFPYIIRNTLCFLALSNGKDGCLARIIDVKTVPGTRFNYQGPGKPIVEDPDGDSCVWEVAFEVVPVPEDSRTYLMRWNPAVSSFTEKDLEECVANMIHGMFRLNWSIREWEEARRGDFFYMMRIGDDKAGIVFKGQFLSDPYPADDWAGSTKRRMYVDMICDSSEPDATPRILLERLQTAIPAIDWSEGHSGVLLSEEITTQLDEMWEDSHSLSHSIRS